MSSLVTTVFKLRWRRNGMARRQLEAAVGGQRTCQSGTKVRGTAPRIWTGNIVQPVLFQSFWMSLWVVAACVFFRVSHSLLPSVIFSTQDSFGKWSWLWYEFGQPCSYLSLNFVSSVSVRWERFQENRKSGAQCGVTVVFMYSRSLNLVYAKIYLNSLYYLRVLRWAERIGAIWINNKKKRQSTYTNQKVVLV